MRLPSPISRGQPCAVYVLSDAHGGVLYVGMTARGIATALDHSSKPWWPEVASATFEHFPRSLVFGGPARA
jgi:hypothetical protein